MSVCNDQYFQNTVENSAATTSFELLNVETVSSALTHPKK